MSQAEHPDRGALPIFAVVVLYGMDAKASPAACALQDHGIPLLLWDNSPAPPGEAFEHRATPLAPVDILSTISTVFHADAGNPGLAAAYNATLRLAASRGAAWLMLLDQDTEVTLAYLEEVSSTLQDASLSPSTVVLLPRLVHRGTVVSPVQPRAIGPHRPFAQGQPWQAFNSGAVLRVNALQQMGGFDTRFPLDYLDHATFAALQQRGGHAYVLHASLEHPLSSDTGASLSKTQRLRQAATLAAERRFYHLYGTQAERRLLPLRLLRRAASVAVHKRDWRSATQLINAALLPTDGTQR